MSRINESIFLAFVVLILTANSYSQSANCNLGNAGAEITVGASCSFETWNSTNNSSYWNSASGCGAWDGDDVWAWFTATSTSTTITYSPGSGFDPVLHLFTGACSTGMSALACADDAGSGSDETITYATTVGQVYMIRIQDYWDNASYTGELCVYDATGGGGGGGTCDHEVCLEDTYGDGWGSNSVDVLVNGVVVLNDITLGSGYGPACFSITADVGDDIDVVYNANGSFTYENDFYLYDNTAALVGSGDDANDISVTACVAPTAPSNDLCADATALPCGTNNLAGTTNYATAVADDASCASDYGVWYTFTGDGQETTIDVDAEAGYDQEIVIYSGSCGSLTNIDCEDAAFSGGVESYTFITTNAVTYYVYVASSSIFDGSTDTGDFTISRSCSPVYTVTFNANGGTGTMTPQAGNSSASLNSNTFTQSSCYFLEWNTAADGSGTSYADGATYSFASDVTLYAQWVCGAGCLHTLELYDYWSDGWQGATVDVTVNGSTVLSGITLASGGGPGTHTFPADNGDAIEIIFTGASSYDDECYFDVYDGYGNQLENNYYPDLSGLTWTGTGNCDAPVPVPGQDCSFPLLLCSSTFSVGNPGYSGTGAYDDFDGTGNCTGGEKNSMWLQIDIAATGDFNFTIMPNDGSNNSNGAETDYDYLVWRISGTGATTDCNNITASPGDALVACNYDGDGVTGVAPGGNAPAPINSWFDAAFEPTVSVTAGDVLLLCVQNFSGSTQGFNLDFGNSGPGVVDYSAPSTIYWTAGNSTTDWTDQANWGNCSVSPVCGVNAIVTSGVTNQPLIPTGDTRYVEDLTINPSATLTLQNNATLHVCGDFTNNGNIVFGANSTIVFDGGSATQNIYGSCTGVNDFGHFVINKTGGEVILNCDIEIAGDFTSSSNTSVLNTNGYHVYLEGDFNNFNGNATYTGTGTTGTLSFIGTANQDYDEGASQLDLNNIIMNNSGAGVNLLTNMYAKTSSGTLTLTDGLITTNGFEVFMQNDPPGAITGQSVASYVNGNLRRNLQSTGAYEFPVGNTTKGYQNAEVDFTAATSINNLIARFDVYPGAIPTQGGTECSTTYSIPNEDNGYWTIEADANSSTGMYDMTLYPTNATNTATANGWTVTKKPTISTGTWGLNGTCAASSTAAVVIRRDMVGFSVFGVAQATIPLPVNLVDFNGKIEGQVNHLYWETASEINSDHFEVLKSANGLDFEKIAEVDAARNSSTMRYYDLIDYDPFDVSYYRLVLVDQNGSKEYSDVVRLERDADIQSASVIPNPNNGLFNLDIQVLEDLDMKYKVYDYTGRIVAEQSLGLSSGKNQISIDLSSEANGIYTLIIFDANNMNVKTIKVLKQD